MRWLYVVVSPTQRNEHVVLRRTWYPSFSPTTTESSLTALVLICMPTGFCICCLLTHICAGVAIRFPPKPLQIALQLLGAFFVMLLAYYCCTRLEVSSSPHLLRVECVVCMLCAVYPIALVVYGRSAWYLQVNSVSAAFGYEQKK